MKTILITLISCAIAGQAFLLPEPENIREFKNSDIIKLYSDSVHKQCLEKYGPELAAVKKILASELKGCKSSENPKECRSAAIEKARVAGADIAEKIRQCVAEGSVFVQEDNDINDMTSGSVHKQCLEKYAPEFAEVKDILASELKACRSSDNRRECVKAALKKAKNSGAEIVEKIRQCVAEGSVFVQEDNDINDMASGSVHKQCLEKYGPELAAVKKTLASELKGCKSSENRRECVKAALKKAKNSGAEIVEKIRQCITDGSASVENINEANDNVGADHKKCLEKYAPELAEVKDDLVSELKACRSSNNARDCIKAALEKAKINSAKIVEKIRQCIAGESVVIPMSVHKQCLDRYAPELAAVKENLASELQACKSSENPKDCTLAALEKARLAGAEIAEKIRRCVAAGGNTFESKNNIYDYPLSSVYKQCFEKYAPELAAVKKSLYSELKSCKTANNPKECVKAALAKDKAACAEIAEKIIQCIANDNGDFNNLDNDLIAPSLSINTKCLKKYEPELVAIKEKLLSEYEACKSSHNPIECAQAVSEEAEALVAEILEKISQCIEEGSSVFMDVEEL